MLYIVTRSIAYSSLYFDFWRFWSARASSKNQSVRILPAMLCSVLLLIFRVYSRRSTLHGRILRTNSSSGQHWNGIGLQHVLEPTQPEHALYFLWWWQVCARFLRLSQLLLFILCYILQSPRASQVSWRRHDWPIIFWLLPHRWYQRTRRLL